MTDKLMLKRIRHQTIRNMLETKKTIETIEMAHMMAFIVDFFGCSKKIAKRKIAHKLRTSPEKPYDAYKKYLVERRIVAHKMGH